MNPFETETMAELCLRQGLRDEGTAIYRRLIARASDDETRHRLDARLAAIKRGEAVGASPRTDGAAPVDLLPLPSPPTARVSPARLDATMSAAPAPLPAPGLRTRFTGDALTLDWRLPPATMAPEIELLLVVRGPAGVETETRSLRLGADAGRLCLEVTGLHSARAALGFRRDGRFVPLYRG